MSNNLDVNWIICPQTPPQPILPCAGCGTTRNFRSSGKIRLNANGKTLDGWLIYRCAYCDHTWNRSIVRRKKLHDIAPETLRALQDSDPNLVRSIEFDRAGISQTTDTIKEFSDTLVRKETQSVSTGPWSHIKISMTLDQRSSIRLDRLLANELGLSRTRIRALVLSGHLRPPGDSEKSLQRALKHGTCITIDLAGLKEADILVAKSLECAP